jgi:hypothetical protein
MFKAFSLFLLVLVVGCSQSEPISGPVSGRLVEKKEIVVPPPPPPPPPKFYASLYCYESMPNRAANSHNFATFVRWAGADIQRVTISWYPARTDLGLLKRQAGKNWDLASTLDKARADGRIIEELGPYEVQEELWQRAVAEKARLESGSVDYQALSGSSDVCNCIHAVLHVVGSERRTGSAWGRAANKIILHEYHRYLIQPGKVHPEVPRL